MKVILINGSPNPNGCTFTALSEIAETLQANGVESEMIQIGRGAVQGCTGCRSCTKTGRCVFEDQVNDTIEKVREADGLIVGTPVYYASPNGSLISFLDRLFFAGSGFEHKPAAAVCSARRGGTTASFEVLNKYFTISQMPVVSSTYWNMVHGGIPDDVRKDEEGLQTMRNLARNMAYLIRCRKAAAEQGILPPKNEKTFRTSFIR